VSGKKEKVRRTCETEQVEEDKQAGIMESKVKKEDSLIHQSIRIHVHRQDVQATYAPVIRLALATH